VKNLAIVKSTGDDDLDQATLTCVSNWHYRPATRDGVAVEISWNAQVNWMMHGPAMSPCGRYAKVTPELLAGITGVTKVSLRIQQDGSVSDTGLMRSSGNDVLDQAALLCISRMRFDVSRARLPTSGIAKSLSVNWRADLPPATRKTDADKFQNPSEAKLPSGTTPPTVVQFSFCGAPSGSDPGNAGTTEISFKIGIDGVVKAAAISKSSGDQALDNATERCIAAWKYAPATKDGKPVEVDWSEHIDWHRH
jgi:TonB family protein